jgi:hypothetical protein
VRNISEIVLEKPKTHIFMFILLFFENRAVYGMMCKIMEEPDRTQMTIQCRACALHAGYARLQTYAQNVQYLLLFHCNKVERTRLSITFILTLSVLLFIDCYGLFNIDISILDYVSLEGRITNK